MKDKEFITLCRALDLKPDDSVIVTKFDNTEKRYVVVIQEIAWDKETGVAFVKSNKGNVTLASEIYALERNRELKGSIAKKEVS